jgi:hypothetical protein
MSKLYRYVETKGSTVFSLTAVKRHIHKVGEVQKVFAYDYHTIVGGCPRVRTRVKVVGVNGTAAFGGLTFGYGGEGPHGTVKLLEKLGVVDTLVAVPLTQIGYQPFTPSAGLNKPILAWTLLRGDGAWKLESTQTK